MDNNFINCTFYDDVREQIINWIKHRRASESERMRLATVCRGNNKLLSFSKWLFFCLFSLLYLNAIPNNVSSSCKYTVEIYTHIFELSSSVFKRERKNMEMNGDDDEYGELNNKQHNMMMLVTATVHMEARRDVACWPHQKPSFRPSGSTDRLFDRVAEEQDREKEVRDTTPEMKIFWWILRVSFECWIKNRFSSDNIIAISLHY